MTNKLIVTSLIIIASFGSGCATTQYDSDTMHNKAAYLSKLTRKVQVMVKHDISDSDTIHREADKKFPNLMKQFADYSLFFKDHNGTAVTLMCNKDETKSLIEDAACTGSIEGGNFFEQNLSCDFHLDIDAICNTHSTPIK